jgi:glycosyltransferase involved in cell wall biosynthesis
MAQGLSHARNAATREARGSFIAWTDDDVLVDPGWLRAYELAIDRHPDATIFGGPIEPWFEGTPPTWLLSVLPRVSNAYALCDLGPNVMRLEPPDRLPFGANFVLRTEAQRTAPYDLALGRVKNGGALGEEHDVLVRLLAHGHIGYWIPEARVRHWLPRQRQSTSYLRRYYALSSRTQALGEMSDSQPTLFSRPRWAYRVLAEETAKYTWRRLRGEHSWVDSLIAQSYALGRLKIL